MTDHEKTARCSGALCWYSLPLDGNGLIPPHSKAGTLDECEGGGKPPLALSARIREVRTQVIDLGNRLSPLALKVHRTFGGLAPSYGEMHTALNRLGNAVNALERAARLIENEEAGA